jgi:CBS domain-containing protein
MVSPNATPTTGPSASLLGNLRIELARFAPFSQMTARDLDFFLTHTTLAYFAPGEVLIGPGKEAVDTLFFIRQGAVKGEHGVADHAGGGIHYDTGDLFPISAAMAGRAVTATYRASGDTFVLALPCQAMHELARSSAAFASFLQGRVLSFLELSARAVQAAYASQALSEQSLEKPLDDIMVRTPLLCPVGTGLRVALQEISARRVGSILITAADGTLQGILTRHDILDKVALPGISLDTPIEQVMVHPVMSLSPDHTAQDAALLMSRHGVRHVPVTLNGRPVGIVSERDLFALQRLSLRGVSNAIRSAADLPTLEQLAPDIRRFAHTLLAQGVQARQLTALISHLNDLLTERLLELLARGHGLDLSRVCWLALGSEGRSEQTIATDQDNALILPDEADEPERQAWLAFAQAANQALARCGFPLCEGGIMAGNSACCLSLSAWRTRFEQWVQQGAPQDLLDASIYFDFRGLAGNLALAQALRDDVNARGREVPRFLKQLALNALTRSAPIGWMGGVSGDADGGIDLKLQGTAIFVDAARLYALAQACPATGTRERLMAIGPVLGLQAAEYESWVVGFEFLQLLRLRRQLDGAGTDASPNRVRLDELNDIDRRILRESLRAARALQQRMRLDYER